MLKASGDEEEMVQVCEPEAGRNLSDEDELRSLEDLRDCQEGRTEISNCQVGNEMRSLRDLIDCQEDSREISCCQEGNEMGSEDLIDCQEGSRKFPDCQVGRGIPYFQRERRVKDELRVEFISAEELTEEKDQKDILIIGGIQIFLPLSPVEARVCVADAATGERQPAVTVRREMEQTSEAAQAEEGR
jgi:hypothetical protein